MLNVSRFYDENATDEWFTMVLREKSVHEKLISKGFTIIDRKTLNSDYSSFEAPVGITNLSYADSIPTPTPGFISTFMMGYSYQIENTLCNDKKLSEILTEWMAAMPGKNKYLMSLFPKSYLFAKSESITYSDVFDVALEWTPDCFIGVFDDSKKMMFVFSEEFHVTHVSFDPEYLQPGMSDISDKFKSVLNKGFVKDCAGRTGGNRERLEEYYCSVIQPFVSSRHL